MNTIFCPITTTSINACNKNKHDVQTMSVKRSISVRHPISFSCYLIEPTENSEDVYKLIERTNGFSAVLKNEERQLVKNT